MINSIYIENYKPFQKLSIGSLARINLIGGKNNSGKTSLLEAIFTYCDRLNPDMLLKHFVRRGVNVVSSEPEITWAPVFSNYDIKKEIKFLFNTGLVEELIIKSNPDYRLKSIPINKKQSHLLLDDIKSVHGNAHSLDIIFNKNRVNKQISHIIIDRNEIKVHHDIVNGKPDNAIFLSSKMNVNPQEDANRFGILDVKGKTEPILRFLKLIEPRLKSLTTVAMGDVSIIHGDIGIGRKIPISFMGEGMSRLLSIILAIANTENGYVLIDEIENGLHYSAMQEVWKSIGDAAKQYNCQIFATTHSYECIMSAKSAYKEDGDTFQYVRLQRKEDNIIAKLYDYDMLAVAMNAEMEVR